MRYIMNCPLLEILYCLDGKSCFIYFLLVFICHLSNNTRIYESVDVSSHYFFLLVIIDNQNLCIIAYFSLISYFKSYM